MGYCERRLIQGSTTILPPQSSGATLFKSGFCGVNSQKKNPQKIIDYRPISLTHSFAKLITKILSNRLGPQLDDLISMNQSALIRKRCLHDNFMFVQQAIRQLHRKKPQLSSSSLIFQKLLIQSIGLF
jgi:hypothetical protein